MSTAMLSMYPEGARHALRGGQHEAMAKPSGASDSEAGDGEAERCER
jgi:hypothetical protein